MICLPFIAKDKTISSLILYGHEGREPVLIEKSMTTAQNHLCWNNIYMMKIIIKLLNQESYQ